MLAGCAAGQADQSAIQAVDNARQKALNTRDINGYVALLSRNYRDGQKDYAAKKQELESSLAAFDRVSYRPLKRTVAVNGDTATISGEYVLKVQLRGRTMEFPGKEEIRLVNEAGSWKIVGGL